MEEKFDALDGCRGIMFALAIMFTLAGLALAVFCLEMWRAFA